MAGKKETAEEKTIALSPVMLETKKSQAKAEKAVQTGIKFSDEYGSIRYEFDRSNRDIDKASVALHCADRTISDRGDYRAIGASLLAKSVNLSLAEPHFISYSGKSPIAKACGVVK